MRPQHSPTTGERIPIVNVSTNESVPVRIAIVRDGGRAEVASGADDTAKRQGRSTES